MKMSLCALLLLSAVVSQAVAADAETAIRTTFFPSYIEALRSHDTARIRTFLHPQVLACMNEKTHQYFDYLTQQEAQDDVEGKYEITRVALLNGPAPLLGLPEDGFSYPLQPTYEVHAEFKGGKLELIRFLSEAHGEWFEVYPCPNEKGVALVHDYIARGEEQRERAAKLVAELKDPLLSELKQLVKQERIIDAVKRYQAETGIGDLTIARMVIGVLEAK
ncbi:MAG TPA: hypothetical protein VKX49_00495 [Bryobacteraceae bacterium]|nr:hypothetical protein [Bryobacteraceae bacterium]